MIKTSKIMENEAKKFKLYIIGKTTNLNKDIRIPYLKGILDGMEYITDHSDYSDVCFDIATKLYDYLLEYGSSRENIYKFFKLWDEGKI